MSPWIQSPPKDEDLPLLKLALKRLERLIGKVDERTGEEMCNFFLERFDFVDENEHIRLVKSQKKLLVEGNLRTGRGTKVHAFLFQEVLVLTLTSGLELSSLRYRVYRDPLPTGQLVLEDLADGEVKIGSFRSTFCTEKASRNIFRLTLLSDWHECERLAAAKAARSSSTPHGGSVPTSPSTGGLSGAGLSRSASTSSSSTTGPRLKNLQTILQTAKEEEKQLWMSYLRPVVAMVIPRQGEPASKRSSSLLLARNNSYPVSTPFRRQSEDLIEEAAGVLLPVKSAPLAPLDD